MMALRGPSTLLHGNGSIDQVAHTVLIRIPIIQCDEQKPTCKNCRRFGVLCNFGQQAVPGEGILQVSMNGAYHMGILPSPSAKTAVLGIINTTLQQEPRLGSQAQALQLTKQDLDTLTRFQFRTTPTLATTGSQHLYQKESLRLACLVYSLPPSPHQLT